MLQQVKSIVLCGKPLDFATLEEIGSGAARPVADEGGMERVAAAHKVIADRIALGLPVYGSNTGVGSMKDRLWTADDLAEFNTSLVRAHHFGTGEFLRCRSCARPSPFAATPRCAGIPDAAPS